MNDQEKEKHLEKFRQNVQWLREQIPPDDIYEFAEQALMAADYFIYKWREWVDIEEEAVKDKMTGSWLQNVVGLRMLKDMKYEGKLNTSMKNRDDL